MLSALQKLVWLGALLFSLTGRADWRRWNPFGIGILPCQREVLTSLYKTAEFQEKITQRQFLRWVARFPDKLGLPAPLVKQRYEALAAHPELTQLMRGYRVPPHNPLNQLSISGGWATDFTFLPNLNHWQSVQGNLSSLVVRMGERLNLDPILVGQLFGSDNTSIGDSGWIIATTTKGIVKIHSSVKVTFFDYDMTPDGPWPRHSVESVLAPQSHLFYRMPQTIPGSQADMLLESPYFHVRSSLSQWGLLPAETQTDYRIAEHEGLLDPRFNLHHRSLMETLVDQFETKQAAEAFRQLIAFRNEHIPQAAREVAEVGRYNIPPGADAATKAQLFYGISVLLDRRPIKTVVALSPRPEPGPGEVAFRPSFEVAFAQPGWEWLVEAVKEEAQRWDLEHGISQTPLADPVRDPLREMYEGLGLKVVKTCSYVFGLPNGAHIMRASRDDFMRRLTDYQWKHQNHLTAEQIKVLAGIRGRLSVEK